MISLFKGNLLCKTTRSIVNIYTVYKLSSKSITSSNALRNSLFGATKVSNTATKDPQKYNYSGYGLAFSSNTFKRPDSVGNRKNVIIFSCNLSDFRYEYNKKQSIIILGYVKEINDAEIHAEKSYTPDFTCLF